MTLRVLIAVTHLLGAGHLTRAAAIGRALAGAGHRVTLVSGGMPAPLVDVAGLAVVQLPPVRGRVDDFTTLRDPDGRPVGPDHLARRRTALLRALASSEPELVVTELFPFGRRVLRGEFRALLAAAAAMPARPLTLCSVRDVLVAPDRPAKVEAAHALLAASYDAVLVHGDPGLLPLDASWPVDDGLRPRLVYTGYVADGAAPAPRAASGTGPILVSGGSSAAALPLYRAAVEAARRTPGRAWHLLVGPGVDAGAFASLRDAAPGNLRVERGRSDFRDCLAEAAVFVGQAGYNTAMDIVATRARSVLVPFEAGRETEQRLRAEALAARGLAVLLPEADLSARSLIRAVDEAAGRGRPDPSAIDTDGAARTVRIVEELARSRPRARTGAAA